MCGITGYLNLNNEPLGQDTHVLSTMCSSIEHRGPDERGMRIIGPAALGMTRLSIIDLQTGQQPITNEDGSMWIVFNGEIYNYQELQERVLKNGHKLATKSDTETIIHLYEDYGIDCLQYLEGMFAFAIWDSNKQRLVLARDRMGEKPLHWSVFENQFIFSSELKAILAHPSAKTVLNEDVLQQYLALEYVPAPFSLFKSIHKLLPAHYAIVENGQVKTKNYWQPEIKQIDIDEDQALVQAEKLLSKSIQLRLISDVPLGIFLSGGIDSSLIAAMAAKNVSGNLKTFSIGFSDKSFDESNHAQTVAKHIGSDHQCFEFDPHLAFSTMTELWNVLDEPIADASILPTYCLSKMTKKNVTVALAGEGGDELFGGYPTYLAHKYMPLWQSMPRILTENMLIPAFNSLPVSLNNLSFDYKVKRFISAANKPAVERHLAWMGSFPLHKQHELLSDPLKKRQNTLTSEKQLFSDNGYERAIMPDFAAGSDILETIMRLDLSTYLADNLLVKSDRASMAASLEVRLPFLAFPLVEFALNLPTSLKIKALTTKYLLRKLASNDLPSNIIKRPKKGFGIPVGKWLKNEFKPVVNELLNESFIKRQGLFQWNYIKTLLDDHELNLADRRKELWTLLMFQWWWRKYFV